MANMENFCLVCLHIKEDVCLVLEDDDCKVKWIEKLELCASNIVWSIHGSICNSCCQELHTAYVFHNMCNSFHLGKNKRDIYCEKCRKIFGSLAEYNQHNKSFQGSYLSLSLESTIDVKPTQFDNKTLEMEFEEAKGAVNNLQLHYPGVSDNDDSNDHLNIDCKHEVSLNSRSNDIEILDDTLVQTATPIQDDQPNSTTGQIFPCPKCKRLFKLKGTLMRHLTNVHATEKNFPCDHCNRKFPSLTYLNQHKKIHSDERPYICPSCGKAYKTGSDLYHHEKSHANERHYKCPKCAKAFNTSSDLHKHTICVHTDRNLWKNTCPVCKKKFPLKINLDSHMKIHEKRFSCPECEYKCATKVCMDRHILTHSNGKGMKCFVCNADFKYATGLRQHLAKDHNIGTFHESEEKKHSCHLCPKTFQHKNKLDTHIRVHNGEKPFKCTYCSKAFADKWYMTQHMKKMHKNMLLRKQLQQASKPSTAEATA